RTGRPWYVCTRTSIAVVEPSGRNQTGSPWLSTTSGPEWLWLFGVALYAPVAAVMSNGARKSEPDAAPVAGMSTAMTGGLRSGRLRYPLIVATLDAALAPGSRKPASAASAAPPSATKPCRVIRTSSTATRGRSNHVGGARTASAQPGGERGLEIAAATRCDDPLSHLAVLDDEKRRDFLDLEARREVGTPVDGHLDQVERVVVAAALEHLRQEAFRAPAPSGHGRVEQDQTRTPGGDGLRRSGERRDGHVTVISTVTWPETSPFLTTRENSLPDRLLNEAPRRDAREEVVARLPRADEHHQVTAPERHVPRGPDLDRRPAGGVGRGLRCAVHPAVRQPEHVHERARDGEAARVGDVEPGRDQPAARHRRRRELHAVDDEPVRQADLRDLDGGAALRRLGRSDEARLRGVRRAGTRRVLRSHLHEKRVGNVCGGRHVRRAGGPGDDGAATARADAALPLVGERRRRAAAPRARAHGERRPFLRRARDRRRRGVLRRCAGRLHH